jgi:hypothetical protein
MNTLNIMIHKLLEYGSDDWCDAAQVISVIVESNGPVEPKERREIAIKVISKVIRNGWMELSDYVESKGFVSWNMECNRSLEKVQERWNFNDRSPHLYELFWLDITNEGIQELAKYQKNKFSAS